MDTSRLPPFRVIIPFALVLSIVGWGGLAYLFAFTLPTLGPRWLFFFFSVIGLTGLTLPVVLFLHWRFPSRPPVNGDTVLRQSIWIGIYGSTLAGLQLGRVLTSLTAFVLAGVLILVEGMIRLRERSRWKPDEPE